MRSRRPSLLPAEWRLELPLFDGPLDLLLHLVRESEVEITDIPVAQICDQFHEYLALMDELDLDVAAEYIHEAAWLIQLKSRTLLPPTEGGAEDGVEDPREVLVARLFEYQKLKEAALTLGELHRTRLGVWARSPSPPDGEEDGGVDLGELSLYDLLRSLSSVFARYQREHPEPLHVAREVYSVREQVRRLLRDLVPGRPRPLLDELTLCSCRAEAIAAFLAVLEMVRLRLLRIVASNGEVGLVRTDRRLGEGELESVLG